MPLFNGALLLIINFFCVKRFALGLKPFDDVLMKYHFRQIIRILRN
jgi:hypothetical protein